MYPNRHPGPPPASGQPFKFTVAETCDRIKEEFSYLQAQYHRDTVSLKLECEKLASEKTEMQRHYVMYYEMSYGLNVEMHKQTEIAKRLNAIIAQIIPFLSQEHQQQVAAAVERAKQVTMTELNAIVGQQHPGIAHLMQQMHAQQLPPHAHAPPLPMMPHAAAAIAGLQPPTLPPSSAAGLLALSGSLAGPHLTAAAAAAAASTASSSSSSSLKDHRDEKRNSISVNDERQRNSISPHDRDKRRSRSPDLDVEKKRRWAESRRSRRRRRRMPASLLARGVTRNESTRSDSSNTSQSSAAGNKKVSFNKAVRVKKYQRRNSAAPDDDDDERQPPQRPPPDEASDDNTAPKRFWFKVYKNKHRQSPDPSEFRRDEVIYYDNDARNGSHHRRDDDLVSYHPNPSALNYPVFTSESGTQTPNRKTTESARLLGNVFTPLHPSQMPTDPPAVRRNHVQKIVSRFNEEAVLQRQRSVSPPASPPGSPRMHSTPKNIPIPPPPPPPSYGGFSYESSAPMRGLFGSPKQKRNPLVNGVKVMFEDANRKEYRRDSYGTNDVQNGKHSNKRGTYQSEINFSDSSETDVKSPYGPPGTYHFGDRSNQLVKRDNNLDLTYGREHHENGNGKDYYFENGDDYDRRGKLHVETFDSGNQLLFDTEDSNTMTDRNDRGEFTSTVGEKHQVWRNNKRVVVYEQPSPTIIRRKAKSQSDLTNRGDRYSPEDKFDKGISTEDLLSSGKKDTLSKKQKDSWLMNFRSNTKDQGTQCNKVPTDEPEELYGFGKYRIIRPRNGVVSAFSNVPKLEKTKYRADHAESSQVNGYNSREDSVIYSQVDKAKKKRDKEKKKHLFSDTGKFGSLFKSRSQPLYIGPPPKSNQYGDSEADGSYLGEIPERKIKTSKRNFGFKINIGKEDLSPYYEDDWYNIDGEVEATERQKRRGKNHRDIAEVRQEIEEEISDASSLSNGDNRKNGGASSVIREVDYKKKEISYDNVPRIDGDNNARTSAGGGMWYRDADEDYRKEMAQSEVSYPAGNSVGSDRFYTVDRREKSNKKPPQSPRAYTLDRRHLNGKDKPKPVPNPTPSGVKILVNGKEVKEKSSSKKSKKREDPSSVQSDPMFVRGGLAAAYQARQRAAVRRSNSALSGLSSKYHHGSTPNIRRIAASSEHSGASSGSESSRQRRPLVMYIPGISHSEKPSSDHDDRVSSIARSQSMLSTARPAKRSHHRGPHKGSKADLYRNGDIYEEDEIMPLASDANRKKPPRLPIAASRKNGDIKRSQSMPKNTKFSWLKWKITGKPSREP